MSNKKVTKAVITAAGYGTRFLPATKSVPKEMLPMIDTPILQYVVEEVVNSGIKDIIIVTRYGNDAVENHFDSLVELETFLERVGKKDKLEEIRKTFQMANIAFVRQHKDLPYGNAAPILAAKPFVGKENFIYAYGDDLTLTKEPFFKKLIDRFENSDAEAVIGAQPVSKEDIAKLASIKFKEGTDDELDYLVEKPDPGTEPSLLGSFGRYVCSPKIFDYLGAEKTGKGGEIWFPEGIDRLAKDHKVLVEIIEDGRWFTTGDPLHFLQATLEFALVRDDLRESLLEYIEMLVNREA